MSSTRILALSDIHGNINAAREIIGREHDCALVFICGDLTQLGGREDAARITGLFSAGGKTVVAVAGNMDLPDTAAWLSETGVSVHGKAARLGDISVFGLGGSNPTPLNTPIELDEPEITRVLERGFNETGDAPVRILLSHPPPFGTRLDKIFLGVHVGSRSVREFILRHDISLCLSGHIHESAGEETLAGTICVNAGAAENGFYAIVDISDKNSIHIERRHI